MVTIKELSFVAQKNGLGIYKCQFNEPVSVFAFNNYLETLKGTGKVEVQNPPAGCSNVMCKFDNGVVFTSPGYSRFVNARIELIQRASGIGVTNFIIAFENYDVV